MTVVLWILLAAAVFFAAVLFHELGHFLFARMSGMRVEEFGIGIPPKARSLGRDSKGTEYTLNWLPIWGFVRIRGEDELEPHGRHPDAFASKPYLARAAVLLAGVAFNFVLAFFVFSGLFYSGVSPLAVNTRFAGTVETRLVPGFDRAVELGVLDVSGIELTPLPASPAEKAGVRPGDIVSAVNGIPVGTPKEFSERVRLSASKGVPAVLSVVRSGNVLDISAVPVDSKIGTYVGYADVRYDRSFEYRYGFFEAVAAGAEETVAQSRFAFQMLGQVVKKLLFPVTETDRKEAAEGVGGPIAIGGLFVELVDARVGASVILAVGALLSVNLGVFNLLPIPALDGGRFFLMTVAEPLRRFGGAAKIRAFERNAHAVGFAFFMILAVVIAFHDVAKFFR